MLYITLKLPNKGFFHKNRELKFSAYKETEQLFLDLLVIYMYNGAVAAISTALIKYHDLQKTTSLKFLAK